MLRGIVNKIQTKKEHKSYGFIDGYDGESYWFSLKGCENVKVGDEVEFEGARNDRGFVARWVHPYIK